MIAMDMYEVGIIVTLQAAQIIMLLWLTFRVDDVRDYIRKYL